MDVFLDEAGYTGADLINSDQPVFVLASSVVAETEARALLDSRFENRSAEIKYARRAGNLRGRRQMVEFLRALNVDRHRVAFFAVHKQFLLLTHLVEYWLEPMMRDDGVNLYERGGNIALANVCYLTLGASLGPHGRRELLRQFQVMTRDRTRFAFHSFWDSLQQANRENELVSNVFGAIAIAEHRLGYEHLVGLPAHVLDVADLNLLETVQHWRTQFPGEELSLFHDRSTMLERQRELWEAILDPGNPAAIVGQDRRTITFPLPVRGLRLEDSQCFPQLQVADLIAGASREVWHARVTGRSSAYCDELVEAGILNAQVGGIVPTALVTPDDLDTAGPVFGDAAEFISDLVRAHRRT